MSLLEKAEVLIEMSNNASAEGDVAAMLELLLTAAQYIQLARLLAENETKLFQLREEK